MRTLIIGQNPYRSNYVAGMLCDATNVFHYGAIFASEGRHAEIVPRRFWFATPSGARVASIANIQARQGDAAPPAVIVFDGVKVPTDALAAWKKAAELNIAMMIATDTVSTVPWDSADWVDPDMIVVFAPAGPRSRRIVERRIGVTLPPLESAQYVVISGGAVCGYGTDPGAPKPGRRLEWKKLNS